MMGIGAVGLIFGSTGQLGFSICLLLGVAVALPLAMKKARQADHSEQAREYAKLEQGLINAEAVTKHGQDSIVL